MEGQPREEHYHGIQIIRVGYELSWKLSTPVSMNPLWLKEIRKTAVRFNADMIIVREIILASAASKIAHDMGIPVIMDMAENYPAAMKLWKKYRQDILKMAFVHWFNIPEKVEEISIPKMDGIITVCFEQNQRLNTDYGVPFGKMRTVHNTPHINNFNGIRLGSNRPPKIFGHHGYMTAEKNLENLLRGFILAAKEFPDIELHLAGSGDCEPELKSIAHNSKFKSRIHFTGSYDYADLNKILSDIDVGVIPYNVNNFNNYTIHNKIFDFMASGKPVIVSNTEPYKRLIEETGAGFVIDCSKPENIADALRKMREADIINFAIKSLNSFYMKYNWSFDKMHLVKFINSYL